MLQPSPALALAPFKSILFPTDFSHCSDAALPFACAIARFYGATIHLAHIVSSEPLALFGPTHVPYPDVEREAEQAQQRMERLTDLAALKGVLQDVNIQRGSVWEGISRLVEVLNIDLIVLGTHGRRGLEHVLLGSVAEQVFRRAFCPVLTVGPRVRTSGLAAGELATILYATDFSSASLHAFKYALAFQRTTRARLILLHAVQDSTEVAFKYLGEALGEARKRLSGLIPEDSHVGCQVVAECGPAADVILKVAIDSNADVIVMGAHGGSSVWTHAPWAVAHAVVCRSSSPVLTVRA